MEWSEAVKEYIQALKPIKQTPELLQKILGLIDLTRLEEDDTEAKVATFLEKAKTPLGHVAAVCVYPSFVRMAHASLSDTPIKVASVANFPDGTAGLETVLIEINDAMQDGAQEIDVVFPYLRYLAGERKYAHTFVESCKTACGDDAILKVILETGALCDIAIIADATYDVLAAGADFVKTSTGKIQECATLEAAATILLVIKHMLPQLKRRVGLKVSGGIRTFRQAISYVQLADNIMGSGWVNRDTFRIGASKLVDEIVKQSQYA